MRIKRHDHDGRLDPLSPQASDGGLAAFFEEFKTKDSDLRGRGTDEFGDLSWVRHFTNSVEAAVGGESLKKCEAAQWVSVGHDHSYWSGRLQHRDRYSDRAGPSRPVDRRPSRASPMKWWRPSLLFMEVSLWDLLIDRTCGVLEAKGPERDVVVPPQPRGEFVRYFPGPFSVFDRRLRVLLGLALGALALASTLPPDASASRSGCPSSWSNYRSHILATPGVSAYWRLDEASGSAICDSSDGGNGVFQDGTITGTHTLAQGGAVVGDSNSAIAFGGVNNGYVTVPNHSSLNPSNNSFSVEVWIDPSNTLQWPTIARKQGQYWLRGVGKPVQFRIWTGASTYVDVTTPDVLAGGVWSHLVATYDGSTARIYHNGVQVASQVVGATVPITTNPLYIGSSGPGSTDAVAGRLDETAFYRNTALSSSTAVEHNKVGRNLDQPVGPTLGYRAVALHSFWDTPDAELDTELNKVVGTNANAIRLDTAWTSLEPHDNQYDTYRVNKLHSILNKAAARNLKVIANVYNTPCFASSDPNKDDCSGNWWERPANARVNDYAPANMTTFRDFVVWYVNQFGPKIDALELENEPNLANGATPVDYLSPARNNDQAWAYSDMLKTVYGPTKSAASTVNPNLVVLGGALAFSDGNFVNQLYSRGAKGYFDGLAIHPYAENRGPEVDRTSNGTCTVAPHCKKWDTVAGIRWIRDIMLANGDPKPLHVTELGWSSCTSGSWCVTESQQAGHIRDAVRLVRGLPYVNGLSVYNFKEKSSDPADREGNFGIVNRDYTEKPAYSTLGTVFGEF